MGTKNATPQGKLKSFDAGLVVGLSYEVKGLTIDGRYYFGTTEIMDNYDDKNSVISLTIGYKINIL